MTWRSSPVDRTVDVPMSQCTKQTVDVVQIIPPERVPMRPGDNEKFVLIRNAGDKRDEIDEKRKNFSTLKDMRMLITGGCRENSNDLTEGGLVQNTGPNIEGSQFRSDWLIYQSVWSRRRSDIQRSWRKTWKLRPSRTRSRWKWWCWLTCE